MAAPAVSLRDVGPRDGLQNESTPLTPAERATLADRLVAAGLRRVEAVSFVRPDLVPQMADPEQVVAAIERDPSVVYTGLVLNERGYDRLTGTWLDEVHVTLGATESFSRRNANASVAEALAACVQMVTRATADGRRTSASISVSFGCPFEGRVEPAAVLAIAERLAAADVGEILFADTIGVSVPRRVRELVSGSVGLGPAIGVHLHDTRGTAGAGVLAGLEAGATVVDASVGGLGGCPFAPGATGNVATEDIVYLLEGEGVATGVDLDALAAITRDLEERLGRSLPARVSRAPAFPARA